MSLRDPTSRPLGYEDAFKRLIADSTSNRIDLPSTYDLNSERYELLVDGSQADLTGSKTTDNSSSFDITANAGERVELRTREKARYVPGYESIVGVAWYMNTDLPDGAQVRVGLRDANNKFETRYENSNGSHDIRIEKEGSETVSAPITSPVGVKQPQIDRHRVNMYGVGGYRPFKAYLSGTDAKVTQKLDNLGAVGNLSDVNTGQFNLPISIEIDCTNASSSATLRVLSMQYTILGDVEPTSRPKPLVHHDLGGSISAGYGNNAVLGIRTDPARGNVRTSITSLGITPTTQMTLNAYAFPSSDLTFTDSNFVTPLEHQSENSVIQINGQDAGSFAYPTVSKTDPFDGTSVTVPDGRLIAQASEAGGGSGSKKLPSGESAEIKRAILERDVVLFIPVGAPGTSGGEITILKYETNQEW